MASFTDAITQFNPYVAQLPVDAMVKVGMMKQQQYEEGYKKIQGEIDKIAGLDIIRDVDKDYLQSKLDELGGNLKTFAAGDFSNFQLVNSVGGMAKQIGKDKDIQTAVASTAWYRKQAQEMESAIKSGKSSQANIWDFNDKANKYISSKDLGRSFSDRYTQYTDVKKKALDAIKSLHPSLTGYDIPYKTDKKGNIDTRYYADAMQRLKIEGIDESKIQQAIYATLTPDDMNQLSIDARYQFRGVDSEKLKEVAKNQYDSQVRDASDSLEKLLVKKRTNGDPTKDKELKDNIAYYENLLGVNKGPGEGELYKQYLQNIEDATNDPDGVKTNIYKAGFVKELGNAFSWKNQESYYEASPFKAQENFIATMRENQRQFGITTGLRIREISNTEKRLAFDISQALKKEAADAAKERAELYGDENNPWLPLGVKTDLSPEDAINEWSKVTTTVSDRIESNKKALLKSNYSEADINQMIKDFASGDPKKINAIDARAIGTIRQIAKDFNLVSQLENADNKIKGEIKIDGLSEAEWSQKAERIKKILNNPDLLKEAAMGGSVVETYQSFVKEANEAASKANQARKKYGEKLADKYGNLFIPALKAVGVGKDGKLTAAASTGVSKLGYRQKDLAIKSDENYSYDTFNDMMNGKEKDNTRVYIKQDGYNYQLVVSNPKVSNSDQVINVTANDISTYLGPAYTNELQEETLRIKISPDASTNIQGGPDNSYLRSEFGDLPNIKNIWGVNVNLLQDPQNENQYLPEFYIYNKSGDWDKFVIAGPNKNMRVGFEAGRNAITSLNDSDLLRMIKENYPDYDLNNIWMKNNRSSGGPSSQTTGKAGIPLQFTSDR